ncbi:hypothetical protein V8E36_004774 [Tilletia maclaganii]
MPHRLTFGRILRPASSAHRCSVKHSSAVLSPRLRLSIQYARTFWPQGGMLPVLARAPQRPTVEPHHKACFCACTYTPQASVSRSAPASLRRGQPPGSGLSEIPTPSAARCRANTLPRVHASHASVQLLCDSTAEAIHLTALTSECVYSRRVDRLPAESLKRRDCQAHFLVLFLGPTLLLPSQSSIFTLPHPITAFPFTKPRP